MLHSVRQRCGKHELSPAWATGAGAHEAELKKQIDALVKQGKNKVKAACSRDGTLNCDLIMDATLESFAETLVRREQGQGAN